MSLINDALKQARQAPPRNTPNAMQQLQPAAGAEESSSAVWLIPAIVIFLIVAAIFFIGWAAAHNTVKGIVTSPVPPPPDEQYIPAANPAVVISNPADTNQTNTAVLPPPVVLPKLQGIFYSATMPTAILNGKTVAQGDQFHDFKVKTISKYTVILIGPDKTEYQVGMGD